MAKKKKGSPQRKPKSKPEPEPESNPLPNNVEVPPRLSPVRVAVMGAILIVIGMIGFCTIPGLIASDAEGNKFVNAFYCSVMTLTTIGFGDICPGNFSHSLGNIFLLTLPILGLGFFCGPILTLASSWQSRVPGGVLSLGSFTLALGVSMLTVIEGMELKDAIHLTFETGTTIGYGNLAPSTDLGRFFWAIYAIMICNVAAGLLDQGRLYLESFCHDPPSSKKPNLKRKEE